MAYPSRPPPSHEYGREGLVWAGSEDPAEGLSLERVAAVTAGFSQIDDDPGRSAIGARPLTRSIGQRRLAKVLVLPLFQGNDGYADETGLVCRFDSRVPNATTFRDRLVS